MLLNTLWNITYFKIKNETKEISFAKFHLAFAKKLILVQFMEMILIPLKCFLLQVPFLGSPSHNWALSLSRLNSCNTAFYLSCLLFASLLCFKCTCHTFSIRQWPLWPLHDDAVLRMFLEMSHSSLQNASTMPPDQQELIPYTQKDSDILPHQFQVYIDE